MGEPNFNFLLNAIVSSDGELVEELILTLLEADPSKLWEYMTTYISDGDLAGQTLLHVAADRSDNKIVRILLSHVQGKDERQTLCNLIENKYGRIPLHTVLDGGCRCEKCGAKNEDCVTVLLDEGSNVNARDNEGDTPLMYATEFMMADCASILLEYGADANIQCIPFKIRNSKSKGKPIKLYEYIAQRIPTALTALLDHGVNTSEKDSAVLNLDFKVFLQMEERGMADGKMATVSGRETDILMCMANAHASGKALLLTHPLTLTFLHFKWSLVRKFILLVQISYFVMTTLYTVYVLLAFDEIIIDRNTDTEGVTTEPTMRNIGMDVRKEKQDVGESSEEATAKEVLVYFICIWWVSMTFNELYEISLSLRQYLKDGVNYAWCVLIVCVGITIPPGFGLEPELWQLPIAAFAVFLAWGLTLVQTSRFPSLGIYIEMLGKVVMDFAIFLITFAALLIGFALAFHILFPDDPLFGSIGLSFVKVVLVMIGEADYEGIFEEMVDPDLQPFGLEYTIPAHIVYIGFIFVITIVLMNLLLGLAVSDIQELRNVATVLRVRRQVEQIRLFESLLLSRFLPAPISKWGIKYFSIMNILDRYDLKSSTSLTISPTDPQDTSLPPDLKGKFISHAMEADCINPEPLRPEDEQRMDTGYASLHPKGKDGRKRMKRLEAKVDQLQETMLAMHEQLLLLQLTLGTQNHSPSIEGDTQSDR